jgi:hypothetical protein
MPCLFAGFRPATLLAAIPFAACATAPPYAPNILAWPHAGESANQFQADDFSCRNAILAHTTSSEASLNSGAIVKSTQSPSDLVYAQCMTRKGYSVEYVDLFAPAPPAGYGNGNAYPRDVPNDAETHPGGNQYYITYPYAVGSLPFFFFVRHRHDDSHHGDFHS